MRKKLYCLIAVAVVLLTHCSCRQQSTLFREWPRSTPEQQGIDSRFIVTMVEKMLQEDAPIHSVLIFRNGVMVTEAYFNPFQREDRHILYSATKSFTTLLAGIAIHDGLIKAESAPVLDLLAEYRNRITGIDDRKKALQLRHLLTMTDGFNWQDEPYGIREQGDFSRLLASDDGVSYILNKPMKARPGEQYNYNSGASYLLAAIIQKASGKTALQYANERLFEPLGIRNAAWGRYQGINNGGSEMFLKPADTARIGQLILNQGRWDEKQIIDAAWINKSIQQLVTSEPKLKEQYGYGWYTKVFEGHAVHSAEGLGGNYLFVIPDLNMVVVFTGGLTGMDMIKPYRYLSQNILPAARSASALPANPQANQSLDRLLKQVENPEPAVAPAPPASASAVSGKMFEVTDRQNLLGIRRLQFKLVDHNKAWLDAVYSGTGKNADWGVDMIFRTDNLLSQQKSIRVEIGLDGRYRAVRIDHDEIGNIPFSAKGHWQDEQTLVMKVVSAWAVPEKWTLRFADADHISLSIEQLFYSTSLTAEAIQ